MGSQLEREKSIGHPISVGVAVCCEDGASDSHAVPVFDFPSIQLPFSEHGKVTFASRVIPVGCPLRNITASPP